MCRNLPSVSFCAAHHRVLFYKFSEEIASVKDIKDKCPLSSPADWDQTRHKLFDQAVNSLCVVSPIFAKSQIKKKQEAQEKREFFPPRSRALQPERELYVPHVDPCMWPLSLIQPIIFLGA